MRIITAIGNPKLNERLHDIENVDVIGKDIQYQEGIFEVLETTKDLDVVAISNSLPEDINFLYLVDKIKKNNENIEIVVFLEKEDVSIENFLNSKKIFKIYYLDENGIEIFVNSLKSNNDISYEISKEIKDIKKIILSSKKLKSGEEEKSIESKIIAITGNPGSGKSVISCILAKQLEKQKKKVALVSIDNFFDIEIILGVENKEKINRIIKVSNYLCLYEYKAEEYENSEQYSINIFLNNLNKMYDYIIFDLSSNYKFKYINTILNTSDRIVFLLEPNLLEISKAQRSIEVLINDYNIEVDKIKIVFNKTNKYQIAESILEEVFSEFEKIGNITNDEKYNSYINQHLSSFDIDKIYKVVYEN